MNEGTEKTPHSKQKMMFYIVICFLLIGFVFFFYWLKVARFKESTEDAYVSGNLIEMTAQIPGTITRIHVDDTQYVEKNQLLVELDPTDYEIAFSKSQANLAETVRNVSQIFLDVLKMEAELGAKEAAFQSAYQDYENRIHLSKVGGVSKEEFTHIEMGLKEAKAMVDESYYSLQGGKAQVMNTTVALHPLVQQASDVVREAFVNLIRCKIVSPVSGYVAMRSVQLGSFVSAQTPLLAVIPLDQVWVNANFKEIQLSKIRIGQPVTLTSDLYGSSKVYQGKIEGINVGTGSTFSLLPPQNATGNWIKVVQRVPVRIGIDKEQLKKYPLWLGLSMDVSVDIHDTKGEMLSTNIQNSTLYKTDVYSNQKEGIEEIIERIIIENTGNINGRG